MAIIRVIAIALAVLSWIGAFQAPSTASRQSPTSAAERLRTRYWRHISAVDPLDACVMGVPTACDRLPDLGDRAHRDRTVFEQTVLEELNRLPLNDLPDQLAMDMVAMRRLADHWLAGVANYTQLGNLEYAENVPTLLILQAGRAKSEDDWRQVTQRLLGFEVLLRQQERNLEMAVDLGHAPDHVETLRVAEHVVPGAVRMLNDVLSARAVAEELSAELVSALDRAIASATGALRAHGSFLEQLAERLPRGWRPLGEAETARRLSRDGFGNDPRALFEQSAQWIAAEQQRFVHRARAADLHAPTFAAAVDAFNTLPADHPKNAAAAIQLYRERVDRLNLAAHEAGLAAPPSYEVDVVPAPLGYGFVSPISNIPPVLEDPASKPLFIISVEPQFLNVHDRIRATTFTAHEATPGHAYVEAWWQNQFGDHDTPVALSHRHDLVNAITGYWGTMPMVEGMGLLAEGLLESSYSPLERLAVAEGRVLRAVRVRVDVGLSAGYLDREAAAEELVRGLGMSPERARSDVQHRYSRRNYLGQAWTYWMGAQQIMALQAEWLDSNPGRLNRDFYQLMAQQPPLPADALKPWLLD